MAVHEKKNPAGIGYRGIYTELTLDEKIQITDINLRRLDEEANQLSEKQEAFLLEKCRAILTEIKGYPEEELCGRLLQDDSLSTQFRTFTERGEVSSNDATETAQSRIRNEQIRICRILADRQPDFLHSLLQLQNMAEEEPDTENESVKRYPADKIAYLKNTYTEAAFDAFSEYLGHADSAYYSDFPGVCEALYYGHTTGCILPLENSTDGKLSRFYALLDKYDLRIAAAASVASDDGDTVTKYALLRKTVILPPDADAKDWYMECRLIPGDGLTLADILNAAAEYGLTPVRVDTRTLAYLSGEYGYDLIFSVGDGNLSAMLLFFCLLVPQFTLLGIYREVLS